MKRLLPISATVLVLLIALTISSIPAPPPASGGPWYPCSSYATVPGGPYYVTACPQGDGTRLADVGAMISIQIKDQIGTPIQNILPSDFWLIGCNDAITLCGGSGAIDADSATNAEGRTTISADLATGGCDVAVQVVVQGNVLLDPTDCSSMLCLPINVRSVDYNGDLICDLIDFSIFGPAFPSPPQAYDACLDYNGDGAIDLIDFSIFGGHFLHQC